MDRRTSTSLWRDYGIPMQDPKAYSLQYGKDSTRDPRKGLLKSKGKKRENSSLFRDTTGLVDFKKQVGGILQSAEVYSATDPEFLYTHKYNTKLTPEEQAKFNKWATTPDITVPFKNGRKSINDMGAYDVQGYWKEFVSNGVNPNDKDNHGPDTYKKPNHPTFSNQSMYHSNETPGGVWAEDGTYTPTNQTKKLYSKRYYERMFGREPDRPEHLGKYKYGGILHSK